jgi:uncharacterized protein
MHRALKAAVAPFILALAAGLAIADLPDLLASAIIACSRAANLAGLAVVDPSDAKRSSDAEDAYYESDYVTAMQLLRPLADRGDAKAQNSLGVMYASGQGVPQDYAAAVSWYRKAADRGNAEAENNLGVMYKYGLGVTQNDAAALGWFQKAADHGAHTAQFNLGVMYTAGQAVSQDYAAAINWYRKAANQGDAEAQFNLGIMYANGQGVPPDVVTALVWWTLSAAKGDKDAATYRDRIVARMTLAQIMEAQRLARQWNRINPD